MLGAAARRDLIWEAVVPLILDLLTHSRLRARFRVRREFVGLALTRESDDFNPVRVCSRDPAPPSESSCWSGALSLCSVCSCAFILVTS